MPCVVVIGVERKVAFRVEHGRLDELKIETLPYKRVEALLQRGEFRERLRLHDWLWLGFIG